AVRKTVFFRQNHAGSFEIRLGQKSILNQLIDQCQRGMIHNLLLRTVRVCGKQCSIPGSSIFFPCFHNFGTPFRTADRSVHSMLFSATIPDAPSTTAYGRRPSRTSSFCDVVPVSRVCRSSYSRLCLE